MLSQERKAELDDRLDAAVEAQEKMAEVIELLEFAISGDLYFKSYILDQLRCRLDGEHGFLSGDVHIGKVIEWLEGQIEDGPEGYADDDYGDEDYVDERDEEEIILEEAEILKAGGVDYDEAFCLLTETFDWANPRMIEKVMDGLDFPLPVGLYPDDDLVAQDAFEDEKLNEIVDWLVEQMKAHSYLLKYQRRQAVYAEFGDIADELWHQVDELALSRYGADEPNPSDFVC